MKKTKMIIVTIMVMFGIVPTLGATASALTCPPLGADGKMPINASPACQAKGGVVGAGDDDAKNCTAADGTKVKCTLSDGIKNIVNILLFILGAIAVIMIVVGGIKYTTSNGDSSAITSAKNTILYSVIGLIVALLAYAIVNFVIDRF